MKKYLYLALLLIFQTIACIWPDGLHDGHNNSKYSCLAPWKNLELSSFDPRALVDYLKKLGNPQTSIDNLIQLIMNNLALASPRPVILELGAGNTHTATLLAKRNTNTLVIASDLYSEDPSNPYIEFSHSWKAGVLEAQQTILPNLAVLRASPELIDYLPDRFLHYVLLVNPSNTAFTETMSRLIKNPYQQKLKQDGLIIVKPFLRRSASRDLSRFQAIAEDKFMGVPLDWSSDYRTWSPVHVWCREGLTNKTKILFSRSIYNIFRLPIMWWLYSSDVIRSQILYSDIYAAA